MTQPQRQSGTFAADFEALQASMRGQALSPTAPDYDTTRKVFNGMIDRRPALIARCAGVSDVMRALEFGVGKSLPISIRCGGHSVPGFSVCEGGVMLDLTPMSSVYVDPAAQRRGIGARLLSWLCDEARKREMHALVASIDSENAPSIALFERRGFREVARLNEVGWKSGRWRTQLLFIRPV